MKASEKRNLGSDERAFNKKLKTNNLDRRLKKEIYCEESEQLCKKAKRKSSVEDENTTVAAHIMKIPNSIFSVGSKISFSYSHVLAPMVGGSDLAFRLLCRDYMVDCAYTPMIYSARFVEDGKYREQALKTHPRDHPLVAHFCGNDPQVLLEACKLAQTKVEAVDLNLGCPQRVAFSGHFGSYLLDEKDRPLVLSIVSTLSRGLNVPVFCKIRLLDTIDETIQLCKQLREAGCALIAVHARYRGTATRRRDGPADLDQVKRIKRELGPDFPIVANGNVQSFQDIEKNLVLTGADGIMSAEGLLDDPTLFFAHRVNCLPKKLADKLVKLRAKCTEMEKRNDSDAKFLKLQKYRKKIEVILQTTFGSEYKGLNEKLGKSNIEVALQYLDYVEEFEPTLPLETIIFHCRRMCKDALKKYHCFDALIQGTMISKVRSILEECRLFELGRKKFIFDPFKAAQEREEMERIRHERKKRKDFEDRMVRKAKREGKPIEYYLMKGASLPTTKDIERMKKCGKDESLRQWKEEFSQHCWAFHFEKDGCERGNRCAFLHSNVSKHDQEPSWLEEK